MTRLLLALTIAIGAIFSAPAQNAEAETLVWKVKNDYPYRILLKFFSQERDHIWPSATKAWILADSNFHTYRLSCRRGELICYGAGTDPGRTTWGVGLLGDMGCSDCCRRCGGSPGKTTLTE